MIFDQRGRICICGRELYYSINDKRRMATNADESNFVPGKVRFFKLKFDYKSKESVDSSNFEREKDLTRANCAIDRCPVCPMLFPSSSNSRIGLCALVEMASDKEAVPSSPTSKN